MRGVKVFGIGLSRTGTTSLTVALSRLGLHAYHCPDDVFATADRIDAVTDTPAADAFRELDRRHPGSKFILTVRDLGPWLDSCEALWRRMDPVLLRSMRNIHSRLYGTEIFDRTKFTVARALHHHTVRNYFQGRKSDLLEMDVCAGDGWDVLCPFLGLPRPNVPFPRRNTGDGLGADFVNDSPPIRGHS